MVTKKQKVYDLLKSRRWKTATEINEVAGSESGTRRARELRADGYTIKTRNNGTETEYRIA